MKRNVLIITAGQYGQWDLLEQKLLAKGFPTLRVKSVSEALYRLDHEMFSVILCEDDGKETLQRELCEALATKPFGVTTPVVVLGESPQPTDRSLLTSLLDQYFAFSTDIDMLAEFIVETHELRSQKAKRGKVGPISIPQVLFQASRFRMTGAVVVERADEKCVVYMEEGYLVFASSNRDENRFGEFLVSRGIISRDQLTHALGILEGSKKRLGRILIDEGFLKPQVLQTLLQSQIKHIVFTVFDWISGEFYILPDEQIQHNKAIAHVEIAPLILEGVRFKFDEPTLNREFEPFDSRVSLAISLDVIQKQLHLGKNEVDFLRLVGSGRAIGDLLNLNSYSRLDALKLLFAFRVLGFLNVEHGAVQAYTEMPGKKEMSDALGELFVDKTKGSSSPVLPPPAVARTQGRAGKWIYMATGAAAFCISVLVFSLLTFVPLRGSKDGISLEQGVSVVESERRLPDPADSTVAAEPPLEAVAKAPESVEVEEPALQPEEEAVAKPTEPEDVQPVEVVEKKEEKPAPVEVKVVETPKAKPIAKPRQKVASLPKAKPKKRVRSVPKPKADPYISWMRHANALKKQKRYTDALKAFRKAFEFRPDNITVNLALGDVLFDLGRNYEATTYYERAKLLAPADPRAHVALGTVFLMTGERGKAKEAYHTYLDLAGSRTEFRSRVSEVKKILRTLQ